MISKARRKVSCLTYSCHIAENVSSANGFTHVLPLCKLFSAEAGLSDWFIALPLSTLMVVFK